VIARELKMWNSGSGSAHFSEVVGWVHVGKTMGRRRIK
jgi:hypothetical protein